MKTFHKFVKFVGLHVKIVCLAPLHKLIIMKTGGNIEMKFAAKVSGFAVCAVISSQFCGCDAKC